MSVTLRILKESQRLNPFEELIEKGFNDSISEIEKLIKLPGVDVIVADDPASTIPEVGVGGSARNSHVIYVSIDPEFLDLEKTLEQELRSTFAHELHHCARMNEVGYGDTLAEAMISEGLADHFDIQVNGLKPKPWSIAVMGEELEKIRKVAEVDFENDKYDHRAWFFGSDKKNIPRWAGYSLGFALVEEYMKKTGKTAAELTAQKAGDFLS